MKRRRYVFEVVKGRQRGRQFDIVDDEVRVGRIMDSHRGWMRFSDRSVSRDQAILRWDETIDRFVVTNASNTNPTRVNGEAVSERVLEDGDEISMGDVVLRLVAIDVTASSVDATPRMPLRRAAPPPTSQKKAPARKLPTGASPTQSSPRGEGVARGAHPRAGGRLSRADKGRLLAEIGLMLRAGISLSRILDGMSQRASTPAARGLCQRLLEHIGGGLSLSAAMREQGGTFSRLHVEAVAAGERCGRLDQMLINLGAWEERDLSLTRAVTSALTYPMTVLACGVLLVLLLGNRVLSALTPVFAHTGKPLPVLTQAVFGISNLMQHPVSLLAMGLAMAAVIWGAVAWRRTPRGRHFYDTAILRAPVTGRLTRMLFVARFCNHLKLLYGGGVAPLPAIMTSLAVTDNV